MPFLSGLKERLGIRIIGCVHDLIPIKYPQYCIGYVAEQFPHYLRQLAQACDAIACVSDCTLNDLRAWLLDGGMPVPHLFRIRLGADLPDRVGPPSAVVADVIQRPFVLFVSTIERRKNHEVLFRVFHRLAGKYGSAKLPRLVFVGAQGWGVSDLLRDITLDPATQGLIVRLHDVSDNDLRILYEHALFCVFPSLYEGWGLPVAEALALGKPVICSDRGPLPEVGGNLVEYIDPWDLPGWVDAIERLWLDEDRRQSMAERIVREYVRDDWSVAAHSLGRVALKLENQSNAR
jgi:glycosyltransferase involved in cell wall biosynthesis